MTQPQTTTERIIVLAQEVFGHEIGDQDDFFSIGGDSVNAVEFVTRLEALLGREVELRALWDAETFRQFADLVVGADEA